MGRLFALLALLLFFTVAHTRPPTPGVWWNPAESGRGWNFEGQNDIWSISHFSYGTSRQSLFYVTVGVWNESTDTITGDLLAPTGGQCVGCTYVAPSQPSLGSMRFEFTSSKRGRAIYPNGTFVNIEKFTYGYANTAQELLGTWQTVWFSNLGTTGFAHNIYWSDVVTSTSGTGLSAQGRRVNYGSSRPVLAGPGITGIDPIYVGLVDATTTFYDYFYFFIENDVLWGVACTALKTSPPPAVTSCTGSLNGHRFLTAQASRIAFPAAVASNKAREQEDDKSRWDLAALQLQGDPTAETMKFMEKMAGLEEQVLDVAEQLRQQLEAQQRATDQSHNPIWSRDAGAAVATTFSGWRVTLHHRVT